MNRKLPPLHGPGPFKLEVFWEAKSEIFMRQFNKDRIYPKYPFFLLKTTNYDYVPCPFVSLPISLQIIKF